MGNIRQGNILDLRGRVEFHCLRHDCICHTVTNLRIRGSVNHEKRRSDWLFAVESQRLIFLYMWILEPSWFEQIGP